jgi:ABC-2 type transport system ATP-binding protein
MNALEIKGVSKSFGQKIVLDDISFSVPENCVFGFIGANGAGKTTTMKMILGLLKPDSGSITACGEKVAFGSSKANRLIGYLPDVPEFYGYMRPKEYLDLCAEIAGIDRKSIKGRINELLELVGLSDANKKIGGYSRGMKQRLGVAQALISEPKLLICDEPTSALDPIGRKEILDILSQIKGKATVVFSTHILADVERICDRVAVLNKGKIALESAMGELNVNRKSRSISLEFDKEVDADEVARVLASKGMAPAKCEIAERSIESLFLEAVK